MNVGFVRKMNHHHEGHFESERNLLTKVFSKIGNYKVLELNSPTLERQLTDYFSSKNFDLIFVEWLNDFSVSEILLLDNVADENSIPWVSLADISTFLRTTLLEYGLDRVNHPANAVKKCRALRALLSWDYFLDVQNGFFDNSKVLKVPNWQDMSYSSTKVYKTPGQTKIGLVGQLFDYRGAKLIIELAEKNPTLDFLLDGVAHGSTKQYLKNPYLKNLNIIDRFLPDEKSINDSINNLDVLLIDSANYPVHSGIAARARYFGVSVLITGGDSYLSDLSHLDTGVISIPENVLRNQLLFTDWLLSKNLTRNPCKTDILSKDAVVSKYVEALQSI